MASISGRDNGWLARDGNTKIKTISMNEERHTVVKNPRKTLKMPREKFTSIVVGAIGL